MALPKWAVGILTAMVPVGTYAWVLYTRPNVFEQILEEVKKQEEAEKTRRGAVAK